MKSFPVTVLFCCAEVLTVTITIEIQNKKRIGCKRVLQYMVISFWCGETGALCNDRKRNRNCRKPREFLRSGMISCYLTGIKTQKLCGQDNCILYNLKKILHNSGHETHERYDGQHFLPQSTKGVRSSHFVF